MNPYKVFTHVPPFLHGSLKQRLWPEFQEQKLSVSLVSCLFVFFNLYAYTYIFVFTIFRQAGPVRLQASLNGDPHKKLIRPE